MKKQLLVVSVLALSVQGLAHATYPSAGEESYSLPAAASYQAWGVSKRVVEPHNPFPFGGGNIDD